MRFTHWLGFLGHRPARRLRLDGCSGRSHVGPATLSQGETSIAVSVESLESRRLLAADFGDAPDSTAGTGNGNYQTLSSDDGPSHVIDATQATLFLGARVDGNDGALQNATADADDRFTTGGADDEDGVLSPVDLQGTVGAAPTVTLLVTNTTGSSAMLSGWIDSNHDGVFENATERTQATIASGTNGSRTTLTFPAIPEGSAGKTYARFRLSTDPAAANSTGVAADGEVEDYGFAISVPATWPITVASISTTNGTLLTDPGVSGRAMASGDLDGDGVGDLAIGRDREINVLLLNSNGTIRSTVKTGIEFGTFGGSLAWLGDVDGNGANDLAVVDVSNQAVGSTRGAVHVLLLNSDGSVKSVVRIASGANGGPTFADGDEFGCSVAALGDLDGDGIPDLAVGAKRDDTSGTSPDGGAVYVLRLNANGTVKSSSKISGNENGGPPEAETRFYFGQSMTSLSDLDGDGLAELVVGSESEVHLLMLDANGFVKDSTRIEIVRRVAEPGEMRDYFGSSLASPGDLDGDGVSDLVVGARGDSTGGYARGAVHVLMLNANGTVKSSVKIAHNQNGGPRLADFGYFGESVASVGDLDGDGISDLVIGGRGPVGLRVLLLNANGTVKSPAPPARAIDELPTVSLGESVPPGVMGFPIGDLNGDGVTDVAVGFGFGNANSGRGGLELFLSKADGNVGRSIKISSGTNGGPTLAAEDFFGASVAALGDLDGDGIGDLAVGAKQDSSVGQYRGAVHVLMLNANGTVKRSIEIGSGMNGGPALGNYDIFGSAVAALGDLDGDGVTDLAVGTQGDGPAGTHHEYRGAIHVLFLNTDGSVKRSTKIAHDKNGGPSLHRRDYFGCALASVGDIDGDGITDLAIGAYGDDQGGSDRGAVYLLLLNADGTAKSSTKIAGDLNGGPTLSDQERFGRSLKWGGDLNGDGLMDLTVGTDRGVPYVLHFNTEPSDLEVPVVASIERQSSSSGPSNDDTLVFRVTLSEMADEVDVTDFVVDGSTTASVTSVSSVSGSAFEVTVSGGDLASFSGVVGLNFAPSFTITALSGNALSDFATSLSETFVLDNTAPTAAIIGLSLDPRTTNVGLVTIDFSESVTGVDVGDFSLTRDRSPVSLAGLTVSGDGASYSLDLSSVTTGLGDYVLKLHAGRSRIQDAAGNTLPEQLRMSWTRVAPSFSLSVDRSSVDEAGAAVVTATLSQVTDVDVTVNLGYAGTANGLSDYSHSGASIVISAGSLTGFVMLSAAQDTFDEAAETVIVRVLSVTHATVGAAHSVIITIDDDDAALITADVRNGMLTISAAGESATDVRVSFDVVGQQYVVASLTDGVPATVFKFAVDRVTQGLQVNLGPGDDRFDAYERFRRGLPTTIHGGAGNDQITLGGEHDIAFGGDGDDLIFGGGGRDSLFGEEGRDTLYGQGDVDLLDGGAGIDLLDGGGSMTAIVDQLEGSVVLTNNGYQTTRGERAKTRRIGSAVLFGGAGDESFDISRLRSGHVTVFGGDGNDTLTGGRTDETFFGQNGDDVLLGQGGVDTLSGGAGDDRIDAGFEANELREEVDADLTVSTDRVTRETRLTGLGNDTLLGNFVAVELTGGDSANRLDVSEFAGRATLLGGGGADVLLGSAQSDRLEGGVGNDTLLGQSGDDVLLGGAGRDELSGGFGNDVLTGGRGDDLLKGGFGRDRVVEQANSNFIVIGLQIQSSVTGTDELVGVERIRLIGGDGANVLDARQSSLPVQLFGERGNDTLMGSPFNDTLRGGDNDDIGGIGAFADDILMGGPGKDVLSGGAVMRDSGNDVLSGAAGHDTQDVLIDAYFVAIG